MNKFYLPNIEKITIEDYSLYSCPMVIKFNSKLNIIFGTNGTGKSTLLMIILFSIIGLYRGGIKTKTRNQERKDNRPCYDENFFESRTPESDINAVVIAEFKINKDRFIVKHSLYNGKLLSASVNNNFIEGKVISYKTYETKYSKSRDTLDETELTDYLIYQYQEQIRKSTALPGGINTLISMLLEVMFFDEERKFTFWNADLQETVIGKYIVDKQFYEDYCEKKLDSKALASAYKKASETANFMTKFFEKEKKEKISQLNVNDEEPRIKVIELEKEIEKNQHELEERQRDYKIINDRIMIIMRECEKTKEKMLELDETWYNNLFPSQYGKYYKKFSKKMMDSICPICGEKHGFDIKTEMCIFCDSKLKVSENPDLIKVDIERRDQQLQLTSKNKELENLKKEQYNSGKKISDLRIKIEKAMSLKNQIEISFKPNNDRLLAADEERLDKARRERDIALEKYNTSKAEENRMKKVIEDSLVGNFKEFSTSFNKYAISFFGASHNLQLFLPFSEDDSLDEMMIKFKLDGKDRDESYMLSESQRIFTDLAFRFSILTTFHEKSFFMCETPDSTLDLFHEKNAVNTFKEYIKMGNRLIVTANARKSNLISMLYKSFNEEEKTVIDLTELSKLALSEKISFYDYLGGEI